MMYIDVKIVKICEYLREHAMKTINMKKNKNEIINKITAGII